MRAVYVVVGPIVYQPWFARWKRTKAITPNPMFVYDDLEAAQRHAARRKYGEVWSAFMVEEDQESWLSDQADGTIAPVRWAKTATTNDLLPNA